VEARCFFRHHLCNKNQSLDADNAADEPAVKEGKVTPGGKYPILYFNFSRVGGGSVHDWC
jgi:hypothetical protein